MEKFKKLENAILNIDSKFTAIFEDRGQSNSIPSTTQKLIRPRQYSSDIKFEKVKTGKTLYEPDDSMKLWTLDRYDLKLFINKIYADVGHNPRLFFNEICRHMYGDFCAFTKRRYDESARLTM